MEKAETGRLQKYEKPQIHEIELKVDEVLGTGCKFSGSPQNNVGIEFSCGLSVPCSGAGT